MLESFVFAFNAVMPILLLMLLGYWLKHRGVFREETLKQLNDFVFRFVLSAMMFRNIYSLRDLAEIPVDLMIFSLVSIASITLFSFGAQALLLLLGLRLPGWRLSSSCAFPLSLSEASLKPSLCQK